MQTCLCRFWEALQFPHPCLHNPIHARNRTACLLHSKHTICTERPFIRPSQRAARTLHLSTLEKRALLHLRGARYRLGARLTEPGSHSTQGPWWEVLSRLHTSGSAAENNSPANPTLSALPISYTQDEDLKRWWNKEVVHAKSLRSCSNHCDQRDCSPGGSSVPGALQARTLEWDAMPSSRGSSWTQGSNLHLLRLLH